MDYNNMTNEELLKSLDHQLKLWTEAYKKSIILEEGKKAIFSQCVLNHKFETKSIAEAEHKAKTDPKYVQVVEHYAQAESDVIRYRYGYNNIDRAISLRQSEIKANNLISKNQY